jgi:predicted ester cyclase
MSLEENKAIVRRFWDAVNQGDLKAAEDTLAASYKGRIPGQPELDAEGVCRLVAEYRRGFPDMHFTIEEMVAEGDKVATRVAMTGTHTGEFQGIAPTGKQVRMTGTQIDRVLYGRSVRTWADIDALGLLQQLGALPVLEPAPTGGC